MLWQPTAPSSTGSPTGKVPDSDTLRQRALQASWRRDRQVSRRRLALRWVAWFLRRYLLPGLGVFLLGAALYTQLPWAGMDWPLEPVALPDGPDPMALPSTPDASAAAPVDGGEASGLRPPDAPPAPPDDAAPLALRLEPGWRASPAIPSPQRTTTASPDDKPPGTPNLHPENWLHSKEP